MRLRRLTFNPTVMQKFILVVALLAALVPLSAARAESALDHPLEFKFNAVDGRKVDLAQLRGKVVLIDFWATWCPGCREEMPGVLALYKKYHAQGFEVVGISLDQDKDSLVEYTKTNGMQWPQFFDGQGWDNEISSHFGISEIPAMVLLGKDGKVVRSDGNADLAEEVGKLLKTP